MENGKIKKEFSNEEIQQLSAEDLNSLGIRNLDHQNFVVKNNLDETSTPFTINNFNFSYKKQDHPALLISDLRVPPQSIVAILGPNGAGKSTFARCLCGLEKKATGHIKIEDTCFNTKERIKHSYMVMQDVNHQLFSETVEDEILLSMQHKDLSVAETYLQLLDTQQFAKRHPLSLSGGQKQRVAIASALANEAQWIVFDEPTSGLDYRHMLKVAHSIKDVAQLGKTLFIVSHDFEFIAECCNYYIHIEKGQHLQSGKLTSTILDNLYQAFA